MKKKNIYLYVCRFMPESIRWLLTNGKKEEAVKILKKAAIINKTVISETEFAQLSEEGKTKGTSLGILEITRYPRTVIRSLNIFLSWFVNSGVYYGLALNSANLGGNDYVNFILSGAVEVPAYALLLLTLNRFGRKRVLCGCMLLAGIFLVACGFIPSEMTWLLVTLNMIGKLFNAAAYAAIYMFAAELFPTVIRNGGMGVSSVMARVGGILSDYVILLQEVWKPLPHLIFGGVSLTAGVLALLLPETLGKRLPETMEDSEKFGTYVFKIANKEHSSIKTEGLQMINFFLGVRMTMQTRFVEKKTKLREKKRKKHDCDLSFLNRQ
ncbi:Organic cation transporter protein [Orchesella cincta]|uniref:Organic cation transporter protein n=1 Tax=Orchesella cincta TaxID=48709 RepID=A0A1D2MWH5_ORCCI|nr:Organic cation transporter protein [Orchesella cincta]